MSKDTTVLFIRNLKKGKRDQFKAAAVRRGRNMTAEVREFIEAYIKSEGRVMAALRRVR